MRIQGKPRALRLLAVALAGAAVFPAGAQAGFRGKNGRIVYDAFDAGAAKYRREVLSIHTFRLGKRPSDWREFFVCAGAGNYGQWFNTCVGAGDPAYAPDGRRLAFVQRGHVASTDTLPWSYEPLGPLAIANDDGSNLGSRQLTEADAEPAWSPRGRSLVFKGRSGGYYDLYVVGADLNGLRRLTADPAVESDPTWSGARGGWIAFSRDGDLFRIRPDGTGLRRLTLGGGTEPAWSPDGSRIAFARNGDVHVMRADGSQLRRLTRNGGSSPVWSPDGKLMLFRPGRDPYQDYLSVMSSNGRSARQLVPAPGEEGWPSDSPENFDWGRRP